MASGTAQTAISTPVKAPTTPVVESPGTWRHPRLLEISKRQEACTFGEKNVKRIITNLLFIGVLVILHSLVKKALPSRRSAPQYVTTEPEVTELEVEELELHKQDCANSLITEHRVWIYYGYLCYLVLAIPLYNIASNLSPLVRAKDDLSDIPLTPGQRKLLGLPPSSAPPTPGSVYSTPPRYKRTPSGSGPSARRQSFSASPKPAHSPSTQGSPTPVGSGSAFAPPSPHPLLQKAVFGARFTPRGSFGSPGLLGASISSNISSGSSIFGGAPDTPSPCPAGKRSSLALNSKWRYEKGMYPKFKGFRDINPDSTFT